MASCSPRGPALQAGIRPFLIGRPLLLRRPFLLGAAVLLGLAGCEKPPPPPPPTVAIVQINTTADVNSLPGAPGVPIKLRVYQLASAAAFTGAEFFPLYNADAAALGPDLVKKDEMVMTPSGTKTLNLTPSDQVKSIAVFGAYARFGAVIWRVNADVPPHATTTFTVTAGADGLRIVATPGKPAAP